MYEQIPIDAIVVGKRKRPLGDITGLAESIRKHGLMHPITVDKDYRLIAGYHRLVACQRLDWNSISALVLDVDALQAELVEIDENLIRNELTVLERGEHLQRRKAIYETLYPETKQGVAGGKARQGSATEIISFAKDIAQKAGVTDRTIRQEVQIATHLSDTIKARIRPTPLSNRKIDLLRLSQLAPAQQKAVVDIMLNGQAQTVTAAERQIRQSTTLNLNPPPGKYRTIIIDPPWEMQKSQRERRPHQFGLDYPVMTEEQLRGFPLSDFAADDCHLYLWHTHKHLPTALRLVEHWGFVYQCQLTWVKNVGFTPYSFMYSTEHVLFCRKGQLPLLKMGERLDFHAKVREHSRKPDEFYELVKRVSPEPRIDVFSRERREGFESWGNETRKFG